jgi:hypothetical protein
MTTLHKNILTIIFLCLAVSVFGQTVELDYSARNINRIDSLTAVIDKRNPSKKQIDTIESIDSIIGEQIVTIEKQTFKSLCKYTLKTNRTGSRMDIKLIELYLYQDSLIKAAVYYNDNKNDFWKKYYFKDNMYFSMLAFPRGMRISINENGQEYVAITEILRETKNNGRF